jgi:uncharacterized protein
MEIDIRGHSFHLLPQKAVFWKNTRTLLIGDLHLGKITHFRKEGIAVPSAAYENNFTRLDEMVDTLKAERIIFLGDLFHSRYNKEWERFSEWRNKLRSIEMNIVIGNHDILPRELMEQSNLLIHDYLHEGEFLFTHHPGRQTDGSTFTFCGHIHPVYCLSSSARQHIKLSCFVHDKNEMILPSFGIFTGGYEMRDERGRKIYVIAGNKVIGV